jgi:hypothetical protein
MRSQKRMGLCQEQEGNRVVTFSIITYEQNNVAIIHSPKMVADHKWITPIIQSAAIEYIIGLSPLRTVL